MKGPFIYETTATTGTGTVTLAGAVDDSYITFGDHFSDGDEVDYVIRDGNNFEIGRGVYSSNTLTRASVQATHESGTYSNKPSTAITLSGSAYVTCDHTHRLIDVKVPGTYSTFPFAVSRHYTITANTTTLLTQNREYYCPFYWEGGNHDSISVVVKIASAGTNVRLALYSCAADGLPDKLVVDAGAISSATTGLKTASYTAIYSNPGWYFAFCITDATSSTLGLHGIANGLTGSVHGHTPLGCFELIPVSYVFAAGTYGSAPSPATTGLSPGLANTPLFQLGVA